MELTPGRRRRPTIARSGPRSPRRGRGRAARRSDGRHSALSTCGRRAAGRRTAGEGPRAWSPGMCRWPVDRRVTGVGPGRRYLPGVVAVGLDDVAEDLRRVTAAPRGPFRSSVGAAAATRSNVAQAASTRRANRAASSALTGRRSASVTREGTPKSVPLPPAARSITSTAVSAGAGSSSPASAATLAYREVWPSSASRARSSDLPERDQPGQSIAVAKVRFGADSIETSTRPERGRTLGRTREVWHARPRIGPHDLAEVAADTARCRGRRWFGGGTVSRLRSATAAAARTNR